MDLKARDQFLFNKQLNYFFDTKHIKKSKNLNLEKKFRYIDKTIYYPVKKKTITINLTTYKKKITRNSDYLKPLDDLQIYLKKNKLKNYFKFFLIHGSMADKKYIQGWSDVDTFVVIKNSVLRSRKKILFLKKKILYLYKFFFKICPLQHHGLIIFSEHDLINYSNNFLPIAAIKKNINLLDNKKKLKIRVFPEINKFLYGDIKDRFELLKIAKKSGKYKHHPLNGKYLRFPLKENRREMYQLFCHLGYMNTLPAYYLSCIGKSVNKSDSFNLFNKKFKNKKIKQLMLKSEKVRFMWHQKQNNEIDDFIIPLWVIDILGKDYLNECILILECIINEIKLKNEKT